MNVECKAAVRRRHTSLQGSILYKYSETGSARYGSTFPKDFLRWHSSEEILATGKQQGYL